MLVMLVWISTTSMPYPLWNVVSVSGKPYMAGGSLKVDELCVLKRKPRDADEEGPYCLLIRLSYAQRVNLDGIEIRGLTIRGC